MKPIDLQNYLHKNIPISVALGVEVKDATCSRVVLSAPIELNINHKGTVFGGSLHSLATLSCWGLVFMNLADYPLPTEIVIANSEIKYLTPVKNNFTVECSTIDKHDWIQFKEVLDEKGKSRIKLNANIYQGGDLAIDYQGVFVAISKK
ncbi:YiiD C-terminal domain-containing protein [Rickettsiales endosymbiont of Stachyamoeba lipophora]|uniref:YiiD C-terminal domain-containing protein n=1 Tax=Rickettsiales endosymbiont of Stachyamoeba lipophora TaxID=2486578 RepID=UPI000F646DD8|nr:YiiD C-terminal domain-containing protein [Rickettsiales endosymbiont of Stachyamoeba lipophora]AZL16393.1 hypothetical protein EF513_07640 [Rickettsiales endosymbiont of Stachyamoeba lipophora]